MVCPKGTFMRLTVETSNPCKTELKNQVVHQAPVHEIKLIMRKIVFSIIEGILTNPYYLPFYSLSATFYKIIGKQEADCLMGYNVGFDNVHLDMVE